MIIYNVPIIQQKTYGNFHIQKRYTYYYYISRDNHLFSEFKICQNESTKIFRNTNSFEYYFMNTGTT